MMRLLICLLITLFIFNCDGRHQLKDSQTEAVKAFNLKTQHETVLEYIPNQTIEIETDTIINHQTHIKISSKLNKHDVVLVPKESTNTHTVLAYQNAQTKVLVKQNELVLFNKNIDKTLFYNSDSFWKFAVLESAWVNQEQSVANTVVIDVIFKNPVLKDEKLCFLMVKSDGSYSVQMI